MRHSELESEMISVDLFPSHGVHNHLNKCSPIMPLQFREEIQNTWKMLISKRTL